MEKHNQKPKLKRIATPEVGVGTTYWSSGTTVMKKTYANPKGNPSVRTRFSVWGGHHFGSLHLYRQMTTKSLSITETSHMLSTCLKDLEGQRIPTMRSYRAPGWKRNCHRSLLTLQVSLFTPGWAVVFKQDLGHDSPETFSFAQRPRIQICETKCHYENLPYTTHAHIFC
jgi:hypothetical protein